MHTFSKNVFLISLVILTLIRTAHAADEAHDLLKRIVEKYGKSSGITVRFSEKGDGESNKGTLSFRGKDRFKLDLGNRTVICNGKTIWVYTASEKRVTIDNYHANKNSMTPEFFLTGVPANAAATIIETNGNIARLALSPAPGSGDEAWGFISKVLLDVDKGDTRITRIEITDANSARRIITVQSLAFDARIPDGAFNFTPPEGTTVVDLR